MQVLEESVNFTLLNLAKNKTMEITPACLYRSSLPLLLQDNSERLEQLSREFGLLFFSLIVKYIQENYTSCEVEFYREGYLKLILENGRELEAFRKNETCYFQFSSAGEGPYFIQYAGKVQHIRQVGAILPLEPFGTIYFEQLEDARAFFEEVNLNAILFTNTEPVQALCTKVRTENSDGLICGW